MLLCNSGNFGVLGGFWGGFKGSLWDVGRHSLIRVDVSDVIVER